MLTGTLVTIAAFVPIGFARSAAGEYTFSIFAVVAIALIASWCVAVLFAPLLGVWILKKPKTAHSEEPGPIMRVFRRFLALAMRARWVTIVATLALFGVALYGMRFVPQQFFPSSDRPELLVDLQLPENASIYATKDASARLDKLLKDDPDVDHWSTYVGQGAVRFYLPLNVQLPNDFFAQAVVVTKGLEQRERVKAKLEHALATEFPSVVGRVYPLELGPPVGWPLQYRVSGREPDQVRTIASRVAELVGSAPGAANVNYNWMEPGRTIKIRVDQDQARLLGLSSQELAHGSERGRVRRDGHADAQRDLSRRRLVRASAEQRMSLSTIRTLQVPLSNGKTVPLSQIASVEYGQEYPIVWRRDRLPTVTVQADLAPGTQAATVVQALAPQIAALNASLPSGYHVDVGGSVEESDKAQTSVAAVLPLMLVIMLTVLMFQLQRFSSMFLVLSVAPMGVIGVVAALLLANKPLGFVAILGVLALTGMIARNSVILIDQIEKEKATRAPPLGCGRRGHQSPRSPDPAHRFCGDSGHDPDRAHRLLGSDGLRDHGRPRGRDGSDPRLPSGALCGLVPDQEARPGRRAKTCISRSFPRSASGTVGTSLQTLAPPNWKRRRISKETNHEVAEDLVDPVRERDAQRGSNRATRRAGPTIPPGPSSWSRWRTSSRYARRRSCWSPWSWWSSGSWGRRWPSSSFRRRRARWSRSSKRTSWSPGRWPPSPFRRGRRSSRLLSRSR